ncbi:hypothetical protein H696_02427 [Fonticula alba]|uniref:Endonuclease/exonuclease/phosphatase domain-containing protein n=1 Tax=Fonticula alba TaxID=691883 RepID=A0A058ZC21_FONAL|nr:hypothetical protein H696_02427 [Fonticula alba]KCV71481.1 hypothetical protein H696_02427 [Fonticula alba]|eukprot:XP_009494604.1 hypothetical protein H696_02427 [Fonticula alba]
MPPCPVGPRTWAALLLVLAGLLAAGLAEAPPAGVHSRAVVCPGDDPSGACVEVLLTPMAEPAACRVVPARGHAPSAASWPGIMRTHDQACATLRSMVGRAVERAALPPPGRRARSRRLPGLGQVEVAPADSDQSGLPATFGVAIDSDSTAAEVLRVLTTPNVPDSGPTPSPPLDEEVEGPEEGTDPTPPHQQHPSAGRSSTRLFLRTLSFNVDSASTRGPPWTERMPILVSAITSRNPDVVALQDLATEHLDLLLSALGEQYALAPQTVADLRLGIALHNPILFRRTRFLPLQSGTFSLCKTPSLPGCMSFGNTAPRSVSWVLLHDKSSRRSFYHFNTRLDPNAPAALTESTLQMVLSISNYNPHGIPVVATGDMAAQSEDDFHVHLLRASGFMDSFRLLPGNQHAGDTYHDFTGVATERPDFLFLHGSPLATAGLAVSEASLIRDNRQGTGSQHIYPSSHFGLLAAMSWDFPGPSPLALTSWIGWLGLALLIVCIGVVLPLLVVALVRLHRLGQLPFAWLRLESTEAVGKDANADKEAAILKEDPSSDPAPSSMSLDSQASWSP